MTRDQEDYALAEVMAGGNPRAIAVIRSAWRWGYGQGWGAGFDRSWPTCTGIPDGPSLAELERRRAEVRPPDGDYQGGPVDPW